jgi:hypothetical protein
MPVEGVQACLQRLKGDVSGDGTPPVWAA